VVSWNRKAITVRENRYQKIIGLSNKKENPVTILTGLIKPINLHNRILLLLEINYVITEAPCDQKCFHNLEEGE